MTVRVARAGALAGAAAALFLVSSCAADDARTQQALASTCRLIGGDRQELQLEIPAPAPGLLRITVDLRGIAAIAAVAATREDAHWGASPIERFATITLVREVRPGDIVPVRVSSVDSRDIEGQACAAAEVITPPQSALAEAARRLAAAGSASYHREWRAAFEAYLAAARILDGLERRDEASKARHAMAQLDYGRLQAKRDAVALAVLILADRHDPVLRAVRLTQLATTLMEMPSGTRPPLPAPATLRDAAAQVFRTSPEGRRELPRLMILAGFEQYNAGHAEAARQLLEAAAADCSGLKDWQCFARARMNLAVLAEEQQNYASALSSYEEALRPLDTARMPQLAADVFDNLGRLESRFGLLDRSELAQQTATQLYARVGDCDGTRRSAASLGAMLVNVGSAEDAQAYLDRAATLACPLLLASLEGATPPGETRMPADPGARGTLGSQKPVPACSSVLPLSALTSDGAASVFAALLSRSDIALEEGDVTAAHRCLASARAYALEPRLQVWLATAAGAQRIAEGSFQPARAEYERALQISDQAGLPALSEYRGQAAIGLARATLLAGDAAAARRYAYVALHLSAERADLGQLVDALRQLASAARALREDPESLRTLRLAATLMEQVPTAGLDPDRRASYLATQHDVFAELTDLMISEATPAAVAADAPRLWEALSTSEEGRARALRYALTEMRATGAPPSAERQSSDYRALLRRIAAATRERAAGSGELASEEARLLDELAGSRSGAGGIDLAGLRRTLAGSGAALVEYAAGHGDMFAFVVTGREIHVVRLAPTETVAQAVAELLERLRDGEPDSAQIGAAARELARLVWWPLGPYVTQQRVIVVPDDSLNTVPFAVLPSSDSARAPLLLQRAEVTTLPSASMLLRAPAHGAAHGERFVLLGDPVLRTTIWSKRGCGEGAALSPELQSVFDAERYLPSLPGTAKEVAAVAAIAHDARPGARVETLTDCAATAESLRSKSADAQLLHVATHGLVDARRPRLSSLVLTPSAAHPRDNAYRLLDILSQPLHSRLVVLSACDTSRGRLLAGEGVLGLAQAFLQAGADSVVASYWRVPDGTTAPFMDRFYGYLLGQHLAVAAALRRAQLDTFTQGNPYSWAAFGLYGRADSEL